MLDIRSGLMLPISEACKRGSYCLVKLYGMVKLPEICVEQTRESHCKHVHGEGHAAHQGQKHML